MFPGSGRNTYNNYTPPQGAPPQQFQQQGYAPPPGAPQQYQHQQNYGPPQGAPQHYQQQQYYSGLPQVPSQQGSYQRGNATLPPTNPQSFGQNTGVTFQYSNCTGKKKALLVGINYFGTSNELRGCINDVKNMGNFLVSNWGYKWEDIVVLTDDQDQMARRPYKNNVLRAMQWLVQDARPNDSLVFHYSGHGGLTEDLDGDEESGYDDVIYPLDFQQAGHIVDDDMHNIMVRSLPPGCRLTALYDSCHSGTALDLPYVYSTKGVVKEPNLWKDAGTGALSAFMQYESGNIMGAVSSIGGLIKKATKLAPDRQQVINFKASPADVISISGCKDDQTSADANESGQSTGAMSWSFVKVLSEMPNQSYLSLLNNMRTLLKAKYSQKPQLSSSHPQDMNLAFIL
ncbi:uncharacterized protein PRCAT00000409001 [Priceomyces carsonii]|uniref:uncharacterized protein n=1 Tax=Priceomyces carsonii TaxID=28549 RepID=UPI002EDAAC98|nr:unnamed protein product [Priceomyces carsonii]